MKILLAFAPFIVFAVVDRVVGSLAGLAAGAVTAAIMLARDLFGRGRSVKVLDVGTLVLFGGLAGWAALAGAEWPVFGVRLRVDLGLLLIVLVSIALRRPFTLQYARERAPRESWDSPAFIRSNDVITAAWAVAFLVMVAADLAVLLRPDLPVRYAVIATVMALVSAVHFSAWYPRHLRARAQQG
ncbi:conserved membrane protein of unknown function [Rhodovastum atsumiense]|uniref:Intracellular septation protein A n=2 Tax=Rhodovastum atsumiense TaxID=504468 RepID=A0A5M6J1E3_9PROT|nr:hypothetical protein F1189_01575 [Rhodovastum atsumiense]CAH2604773.1 conserved membrane protein of unknown function [Rhodovastum atsumiense]